MFADTMSKLSAIKCRRFSLPMELVVNPAVDMRMADMGRIVLVDPIITIVVAITVISQTAEADLMGEEVGAIMAR